MPDIVIIITIPDGKVAKAREGYLHARPRPSNFAGADVDWLEHCINRDFSETVIMGLRDKAASEEVVEETYTE